MIRLLLVALTALGLLLAPAGAAVAAKAKPKPKPQRAPVCAVSKKKPFAKRRPAPRSPSKRCVRRRPTAAPEGGRPVSPGAPVIAPLAPAAAPQESAARPLVTLPSVPVPAAAPGAVAVPQSPPSPPAQAAAPKPDCGTSPWVGYTAADVNGVFKLTGLRTCVPGPNVRFQLRNTDAQEHNLFAEGVAPAAPARAIVASIDPGEVEEASAQLAAGEWRMFCAIEGHETMSRSLTVLP